MNFNKDPRVCLCPSASYLSSRAYHIAAVLLSDKLSAPSLLKKKIKKKEAGEKFGLPRRRTLYLPTPPYLRRVLSPPPSPVPTGKLKFTGVLRISAREADSFSNSFSFFFLFSFSFLCTLETGMRHFVTRRAIATVPAVADISRITACVNVTH